MVQGEKLRYTKQLQADVCSDIKYGLSPQECAAKHGIPVSVVLKWNDLNIPAQRAKEIALRKYQADVSETEAELADRLSAYFDRNVNDDEYLKLCEAISATLFSLVSEIVKKERNLNPHEDPQTDAEIIAEITSKWNGNNFLKRFAV